MKKYRIGKIVKTHGLKGEMKIYSHTDYPERFEEVDYLLMENDKKKYEIEGVKYQKGMPIIKIKGIDRIEEAENFIGQTLYIDEENIRPLEEDEYMIADLVGLEAHTTDGRYLGKVADVLQYTANDIYVIKSEEGKELLIPATIEIVPEILLEENKIIVNPIKGLLEE